MSYSFNNSNFYGIHRHCFLEVEVVLYYTLYPKIKSLKYIKLIANPTFIDST